MLSLGNSSISVIGVDISLYQNSGANMVQQLAYGLAQANEYLNHAVSKGIEKLLPITFKVAVGSNYFFEIAKIKALRWLWNSLASEYGIQSRCNILAMPSKRNKTLYDYNVNMLRTTSESMSAVLAVNPSTVLVTCFSLRPFQLLTSSVPGAHKTNGDGEVVRERSHN